MNKHLVGTEQNEMQICIPSYMGNPHNINDLNNRNTDDVRFYMVGAFLETLLFMDEQFRKEF